MKLPEKTRAAIDRNVPPELRDYFYRLVFRESSGNPNLVSKTGAAGLVQFIPSTGKTYGLIGKGFDKRTNEDANLQAGVKLTLDNRRTLSRMLGREPTHSELALAHQQGAETAARMLSGVGNASPKALAVNAVNPNASPQEAAAKIMNYYGFDKTKMPPQVPGMSLATNPYLPQLQHGPVAPSPFPTPPPAPPAPPADPGLLAKMGVISPEDDAAMKAKLLGPDGKGGAGSPLGGLDDISKGLNPQVTPAAAQAAATITPMMAPDAQGAQNAAAAQQLMAALMANKQRKLGLSLTDRGP